MAYQVINTWNGGNDGEFIAFAGSETECEKWLESHTPWSVFEACTWHHYRIEYVREEDK